MSLIGHVYLLPDSRIDALLADPETIFTLVDGSYNSPEAGFVDLDKAWHCLHYLLTGSAVGGEPPLDFLLQGGTAVAMLTAFMPEWHDESAKWIDAVVKTAAAASPENKTLIAGWVRHWSDRAQAALSPVANLALGEAGEATLGDVRKAQDARAAKAGVA